MCVAQTSNKNTLGYQVYFQTTIFSRMYYSRSGFECEILLIANCEFFHNSQIKESQENNIAIYMYTQLIICIASLAIRNH